MAPMDLGLAHLSNANAVAEVLVRSVSSTTISASSGSSALFDATRLPTVSIRDYMKRLERYCSCSEECFVVCMVYIERILETNPTFAITELNCHRFLLAATIVAAKFQDDDYYSNAYYAKVGGITTDELITLEGEFLAMMAWRGHVSVDAYEDCLERLCDGKINLRQVRTPTFPAVVTTPTPEPAPCVYSSKAEVPPSFEPVVPEIYVAKGEGAGTEATPTQRAAETDANVAWKTAALVIGDHGTQCSAWTSQRRARRRSTTPVMHLNARRTRLCLVAH